MADIAEGDARNMAAMLASLSGEEAEAFTCLLERVAADAAAGSGSETGG